MQAFLPLASFLALSATASAGIVYVDQSATGANDGTSWNDAHSSLRVALDAAVAGDDLWIAQGTYTPGPTAEAIHSFFLKSGVRLYGGFAGGEVSVAQRDFVNNVTILSGDVDGDDSLAGWPNFNINGRNSAHVVTGNGADASALLDGLTISQGHTGPSGTVAGAPEMAGSGMYNIASNPTITNCIFQYNTSAWAWGAAIYNMDSSPSITHCTFRYNAVHLASGAGIGNLGSSAPIIEDCDFYSNQVTTGGGGQEAQGCAIANYWTVPPITVERCTFTSNVAKQFNSGGFGIEQARGGGISSFNDGLTVRDCIFRSNSANAGAAIFVWGDATIVNCLFEGNNVYNMVQQSVTVSGFGSAVAVQSFAGATMDLDNCVVVDNNVVLGESGAIVGVGAGLVRISNSILWGNTAPPPASPRKKHYKGNIELSHNTIENLFLPDASDPVPNPNEVPGCIDLDPLFVSAASGDYRLSAGSPAIDAGLNSLIPGFAGTDLDGFDRVALGAVSLTVDMGAYEFGSSLPGPCPSIVSEPQSLSVTEGQSASFNVFAQGQNITFQWRKNGVNLAGETGPALQLTNITASDAGAYDVVVSNTCMSLTSAVATLTVNAAPVGNVVCSGDGEDPGCPCGNDKDNGEGCENSVGEGARLRGAGTASIAAGDAVLTSDRLPPNKSGIFFMGSNLLNGGIGNWFGDGLLCTTPVKRFAVQNSGQNGVITLSDPASLAPGQIAPGSKRYFQAWYRDPGGPCGSGWNTSNAFVITFTP